MDGHALWVDSAHYVTDRAVLAGCIQRLEHNEHPVGVLGCETGLVVREELHSLAEQLGPVLLLLDPGLEGGIKVPLQRHLRAGIYPEGLDKRRDPLVSLIGHRMPPRL